MIDKIESFMEALAEHGLDPGSIQTDGIVHRFSTWGDRSGETSGAYWHNGRAGWFQDWRTMEKPKIVKGKLSEADQAALNGSFNGAGQKVSRKALEAGIRKIWNAGTPPDGHPYLTAKKILAVPQIKQYDGQLIIPVFGINGELNGLQRIDADGRKRFLTGTRKKGSFFSIAGSKDHCIVCEGFATGVSLFRAMGCDIAVSFDAGNIKPVTKAICKKIGSEKVIIAGDNDSWKVEKGQKDTGTATAKEAARMTGAAVVLPTFKNPNGKQTTDFNDLANLEGAEEVKRQIEQALSEREARAERESIKDEPPPSENKGPGVAKMVREYIADYPGATITSSILRSELGIITNKEQAALRMALKYMVEKGELERIDPGVFYICDNEEINGDWWSAADEKPDLEVWQPFGLDKILNVPVGKIVQYAGVFNTGKTAVMVNIAYRNAERFKINYISTELEVGEFRKKMKALIGNRNFQFFRKQIKFKRVKNYARAAGQLVNDPGWINIIDYLKKFDKFFDIGRELAVMAEKTDKSIIFVAIQKNPNQELGVGGHFSAWEPTQVITLDNTQSGYCIATVVKAKAYRPDYVNSGGDDQNRGHILHKTQNYRIELKGEGTELNYSSVWSSPDVS